MITVKKISKRYPHCDALKETSLQIQDGTFTAIVGRSGSGKSTLLRILGGLDSPTSGEVFYENTSLQKLSEVQLAAFRNKHIGFVFQQFFLEPQYTVYQNAEMPLIIGAVPKKERSILVETQLEAVGLLNKRNALASTLSGGEKQRTAIARAMVCNPPVILADEPCGSLDTENGEIVMKLLRTMAEQGKTVILITHNREDAAKTDRIITLKDGQVIDDAIL
ncbi:MAG: ABC transporter ATP-binding protein [Oscillospiraceae bacterium]|nr:ABC transporter ATP-binding protein [Oscillospiraceae bacterium]